MKRRAFTMLFAASTNVAITFVNYSGGHAGWALITAAAAGFAVGIAAAEIATADVAPREPGVRR